MIKLKAFGKSQTRVLIVAAIGVAVLAFLMLYKLGNLTGGLSAGEAKLAVSPVGWHGLYHNPLDLPLKLVQSIVFYLSPSHGQALTRLPNALFGALTIASFILLIRFWHSARIALLTGVLFATSAWVLHVSRLASFDVLYLWGIVTLLLINALMARYAKRALVGYGSLVALGLLIYIPGMVWLVLIDLFFMKKQFKEAWQHLASWWKRSLYVLLGLIWLPLLGLDLSRSGQLKLWLGLPVHFASPIQFLKHFIAVPTHLFIRGPQYPNVWLGKAPILDVFTLVACCIGIYFYATHLRAGRSRLLIALAIAGWILVALAGPVGLSVLVPLLYVAVAAGIAYLLHEWLQVFPLNPLARGIGLTLVSLAVVLACTYNLRAYFIAWPHNAETKATFHYRR